MRGMQGTRGMFTRIPGNLLEDSGEWSHISIPENARKDPGECSIRFRGMLLKIPGNVPRIPGNVPRIPGNVPEDYGECLRRFQGMFKKIPENVSEDSGDAVTEDP